MSHNEQSNNFEPSLTIQLLSISCAPGTVLGTGDTKLSKPLHASISSRGVNKRL